MSNESIDEKRRKYFLFYFIINSNSSINTICSFRLIINNDCFIQYLPRVLILSSTITILLRHLCTLILRSLFDIQQKEEEKFLYKKTTIFIYLQTTNKVILF